MNSPLFWQDGPQVHSDHQVLRNLLAIPHPFKIILLLRQDQDSLRLVLPDEQPNSQFVVLALHLPPACQPPPSGLSLLVLFSLLISTFVIYEGPLPALFLAVLPRLDCNKEFLPTAYQITSLAQEKKASLPSSPSPPLSFQAVHEIYMTQPDQVPYIIKEFLLNSYQYKKLFQVSLDSHSSFRHFLVHVFKMGVKATAGDLGMLGDVAGLHSRVVVSQLLDQYQADIAVYQDTDPAELQQVHQTLSLKATSSLQKSVDQPYYQNAQNKLNRKLNKAFERLFIQDAPEPTPQPQDDLSDFEYLLEKEFGILRDKLQMGQYSNYQAYEADLQIFINFCFDNLLEKNPGELEQVNQNDFLRVRLIYQFVYQQNTQGALFFMARPSPSHSRYHESIPMVHLNSVDDMTVIKEPEIRQSNCYQQEVEVNAADMRKVIEKVKGHLAELEGIEDMEIDQVASNIRMEINELEMEQDHLENNLRALAKQMGHQRTSLRQAQLNRLKSPQAQSTQDDKYFYERVLQLETELQEARNTVEQHEQMFITKESTYKQQIDQLKDKVNRLYTKSINESRCEITKSDILIEQQSAHKIAQLEGKMNGMQQENENKFNQIRELRVEKEKDKAQMQQRIEQLKMQEQEQMHRADTLTKQLTILQQDLENQRQHYERNLMEQSQGKQEIYKQMNQKLEEENERLLDNLGQTNQLVASLQAQLEEAHRTEQLHQASIMQLRDELEHISQQVQQGQQDKEALEQHWQEQMASIKQIADEQLQEYRRNIQEERDAYERRIAKIKRQITENNPYLPVDDPKPIQESTYEPGALNNSLFNLVSPQRPEHPPQAKNAYELKLQEYQAKIQAMSEEKGVLIDRIDEIYGKYLDQHLQSNSANKQSELSNHVEALKLKLKETRQEPFSQQLSSNSLFYRTTSLPKSSSLLKRSAFGSQAQIQCEQNSLLSNYLDTNQLKTASRIQQINKESQIISRPHHSSFYQFNSPSAFQCPPSSTLNSKHSFYDRPMTNTSELFSRPSISKGPSSSLYHKLSRGLKWDKPPKSNTHSSQLVKPKSLLFNTSSSRAHAQMLFTNL